MVTTTIEPLFSQHSVAKVLFLVTTFCAYAAAKAMPTGTDIRLLLNHLNDLRRSGLSDGTIAASGCFSINEVNRHLLHGFGQGVEAPGLALPIFPPGLNEPAGFMYKPDNPRILPKKNGKPRACKYETLRGALNRIHVPRSAQWLFRTPDGKEGPRRVVVTEGWKKAEKGAQEGLGAVALSGVDNWRVRIGDLSLPIEDLLLIAQLGCAIEICFDSDAATNPHVRRAERALAQWLKQHGAKRVSIVRLPASDDGSKVGLDDYLMEHTAADFEALPRIPADMEPPLEDAVIGLDGETEKTARNAILARILIDETDPAERDRLLKMVARRSRISIKAVRETARLEAARIQAKREEEASNQPPPSAEEAKAAHEKALQDRDAAVASILAKAKTTTTLRAQTWTGRDLMYICPFGEAGALVTSSAGHVFPVKELPPEYLPPMLPNRSPISIEGIEAFRNRETISGCTLFTEIRDFIQAHVVFKHKSAPAVIALWVMATYCYSIFNYFGYIWLTSLGPSHGKSLVAKILSMVCFSATAPEIDPTPAVVFRLIETNGCTFILDEMENLDPEKKGELISLLNSGFERGGQVSRTVPAGDGWTVANFQVFCPKVLACISPIPRVVRTRVFQFDMPKRKPTEAIEAFKPDRRVEWSARVRNDLAIFALRNAPIIAELYDQRDVLLSSLDAAKKAPQMDDRLADIVAPLYAVAAVIDREAGQLVATPQLEAFAALQAGLRHNDEVGDYAVAALALYEWAEGRWDRSDKVVIDTDEATAVFRSAGIHWATDSAAAKSLLRKIGGVNQSAWWYGKTKRGYVFHREELKDLVERHPIPQADPEPAEEKA